jgi:hypothetical protein
MYLLATWMWHPATRMMYDNLAAPPDGPRTVDDLVVKADVTFPPDVRAGERYGMYMLGVELPASHDTRTSYIYCYKYTDAYEAVAA